MYLELLPNNLSIAYRHLGECDKAKDAAENALSVMAFGAARSHLKAAEFCIEMQKLGIMSNEPKEHVHGRRAQTPSSGGR